MLRHPVRRGAHPSEGERAAQRGLFRQNDTRHARGMLKWPHGPPPQVAPGGKNRSNIPSRPAGAWMSRQWPPKARSLTASRLAIRTNMPQQTNMANSYRTDAL
jgi:hypothetical protein